MALSMDQIYQEILRDGGETPSKKVRETAQRFPDMIAMRYKEFGLWQETTYEDFWLKSNYLGMALRHFGVEKGNSVAIHSENRPEWFIADIGIQSMGYVSVGLYPSNPSSEVQYLLSHSESKILFAEICILFSCLLSLPLRFVLSNHVYRSALTSRCIKVICIHFLLVSEFSFMARRKSSIK